MRISDVLVVAEHMEGEITSQSAEAMGIGRKIADKLGGRLLVVVVGGKVELAQSCRRKGIDLVIHAEKAPMAFDSDIYCDVVTRAIHAYRPRLVIAPHSVDGVSYAPCVAAGLGAGLAMDVVDLHSDGRDVMAIRSGFGGRVAIEVGFPGRPLAVVTIRPATFEAIAEAGDAAIEKVEWGSIADGGRIENLGYVALPKSDVDISTARSILAIGRGISDQALVGRAARIAQALGAALGCSRPLVDAGWLPKAHQVGQTGTVAKSCSLYVALGISGAVQHLYGMKHVKTIFAVNTDRNAQIFEFAWGGTCANIDELIPALERQLASNGLLRLEPGSVGDHSG